MTTKTKKKLKTGCLSKTKVTLKTKDNEKIFVGQQLYYWTGIVDDKIISFKVGAWHNGKTSQLLEDRDDHGYFVDVSGRGGCGVYPDYEDNCFTFYQIRYLYARRDNLLANRKKTLEQEIKRMQKNILITPEVIWKACCSLGNNSDASSV